MRVVVVASGSEGNATLVESGGTRVLVDAGIGPYALRCAFERAQRSTSLDAVIVTHAHQDHFGFARKFARKARVPVFVTEATARAQGVWGAERFTTYAPRAPFAVGSLVVSPVPVPHDAPQVALTVSDGRRSVAIVTDVGEVTAQLADHVAACDVLLVESNHDLEMLERGPYPEFLKRRVASSRGHLSNLQVHALLRRLPARTHTVVLMHLSRTNNSPQIALEVARDALAGRRVRLLAAAHRELTVADADAPAPAPIPGAPPVSSRDRRRPAVLPGQLSLFPIA